MENKKNKLKDLIKNSQFGELLKAKFEGDFDLVDFTKSKEDFLDIEEIRLLNTVQLKNEVPGLKESVENIKKSNTYSIVTNLVTMKNEELIIYTDEAYTTLFGIIK